MKKGLIGKKIGMTQLFDENGKVIPVTVVEAGPCTVVQKKTVENDGYAAVQASYFFSCVANYAGTTDADCSTIYGHWYGRRPGNKCNGRCWSYQYSKLADWKYDFCDQHRIFGIHIPVNRSRKKRTGKKSFRTGCADSCDRRNIFYNSDNGTEP